MQRASLVEAAVDQLIELIEERGLRENDLLPSTAELAESLQVSRTVVREAIAELAGQGLVERHQGRETVVSTPQASQVARLMRLRFLVGGRDEAALREYCDIVAVAAARLAAQRVTNSDIDALAVWLERLRQTDSGVRDAEHGFFCELGRVTGNDLMLLTFEALGPLIAELQATRHDGGESASNRAWLDAVLSRILSGVAAADPDAAATAMAEYIGDAGVADQHVLASQGLR
ncbi:MAG: FadR/GntR family transcriptional regulator [Beutenbergiaceae bacterium]